MRASELADTAPETDLIRTAYLIVRRVTWNFFWEDEVFTDLQIGGLLVDAFQGLNVLMVRSQSECVGHHRSSQTSRPDRAIHQSPNQQSNKLACTAKSNDPPL